MVRLDSRDFFFNFCKINIRCVVIIISRNETISNILSSLNESVNVIYEKIRFIRKRNLSEGF